MIFKKLEDTIKLFENWQNDYVFLRFGHDELQIMMDDPRVYFHEIVNTITRKPDLLKIELKKVFAKNRPNYIFSCCHRLYEQDFANYHFGVEPIFESVLNEMKRSGKKEVHNYLALPYIALRYPEKLLDFFEKLKGGTLIGNIHLKEFAERMRANFIEIPEKNAHENIDDYCSKDIKYPFLVSAGVSSPIIQDNIWTKNKIGSIDLGSLPSVIMGEIDRGWGHKNKERFIEFKKKFEEQFNI